MTTSSKSGPHSVYSYHDHPTCLAVSIQGWKHPSKFDAVKEKKGLSVALDGKPLTINTEPSGWIRQFGTLVAASATKTTRGRNQTEKSRADRVTLTELHMTSKLQLQSCGPMSPLLLRLVGIMFLFPGAQRIRLNKWFNKIKVILLKILI